MKMYMLNTTEPTANMIPKLDSISAIRNWFRYMPTCYILLSEDSSSAAEISHLIRTAAPGVTFILAEVHGYAMDGWMAQGLWDFVNNPKDSGRHSPTNALQRVMSGLMQGTPTLKRPL